MSGLFYAIGLFQIAFAAKWAGIAVEHTARVLLLVARQVTEVKLLFIAAGILAIAYTRLFLFTGCKGRYND